MFDIQQAECLDFTREEVQRSQHREVTIDMMFEFAPCTTAENSSTLWVVQGGLSMHETHGFEKASFGMVCGIRRIMDTSV